MLIPVAQIIYHDLRSNEKVIKWCVPSVQSICQENVDICFILIDLTYIVYFFSKVGWKMRTFAFFSVMHCFTLISLHKTGQYLLHALEKAQIGLRGSLFQ